MDRRKFIKRGATTSLGFLGLQTLMTRDIEDWLELAPEDYNLAKGYGRLEKDPRGVLHLPKEFSYKIISRRGNKMSDGFFVPGLADGMAAFPGPGGKVIVIRNHEVSPRDNENGPFGKNLELLGRLKSKNLYDYGKGRVPCQGGTTTFVYNPSTSNIELEYLSLAGTIRNCAGGPTPWNTWISCEENVNLADNILEKNHGYNFEVPASARIKLADPIPLKAMGRFNHEAVCVDPATSIVYQTEDRSDGLIYRFIPDVPGKLIAGGNLQILALKGRKKADTRNWWTSKGPRLRTGKKYEVEWLDIDNIQSPKDDLRHRGHQKGAAVFARGEGMWFGNNEVYFACTNGGRRKHGQIFKYVPSPNEGTKDEKSQPGTLELFIEPNNSKLIESCDNVTIASNGDLVVCEDKPTPRIIGITPSGDIYHLAKNVGYSSEFAGAVFSPDGETLFVNIQGPGLTLAIYGPWK